MSLPEALSDAHDLTCARLTAFSQHVGLTVEEQTVKPFQLSYVVENRPRNNNLVPLNSLRCRVGVYAFRLNADVGLNRNGRVIYVGNSSKGSEWDLRDRIPQHLREKDAGGTLRINWCRRNDRDFRAYQAEIAQCTLWTVSFPRGEDAQKIARLEHLLIGVLGPEYCDLPLRA